MDSTGRDIYDSRYDYGSGSKANRLRGFWKEEPNYMDAQLMGELLDYSVQTGTRQETAPLFVACRRIVERLRNSAAVLDVTALVPEGDQKDLDALTRQVREAIDKNQPDVGLDRLHTFTVKFVRALWAEHGLLRHGTNHCTAYSASM